MVRKTLVKSGFLLLLALLLFRLTGCSLIGLGIGAISDANKPSHTAIPRLKVENIEPGTKINIVLNDSNQVSGKYIGLERVPEEEYAKKYAESREKLRDEVVLPALGEDIILVMVSGTEYTCCFQGFDSQHIWVTMAGNTEPVPASLNLCTKITLNQKNDLDAETVRRLIVLQRLPSLSPYISAIAIDSETGKQQIAMNKVQQVQVKTKRYGAIWGFIYGAIIDALLLLILHLSWPNTMDLGF